MVSKRKREQMEAGQYLAYMIMKSYLGELRDETARPLGSAQADRAGRRPRRRFGRRGGARRHG
jgi:hypothetical protein